MIGRSRLIVNDIRLLGKIENADQILVSNIVGVFVSGWEG